MQRPIGSGSLGDITARVTPRPIGFDSVMFRFRFSSRRQHRRHNGRRNRRTRAYAAWLPALSPRPRPRQDWGLEMDSLRGSSVKIGTIQRRLAWPLRKGDTHKARSETGAWNPRMAILSWRPVFSTFNPEKWAGLDYKLFTLSV